MGKVRKLSEEIISQIAAGEVVERPANIVKELIENSIDANSTEIEINIVDYGLTKIEVIDNGDGMSKEDLLLSFLPHTTSKLHTIEDLNSISTLGFRGEALNSIASVSALSIASKDKDVDAGYKVTLFATGSETSSIGKQVGTHVTVEHLFSNVPARKKFLKSQVTELRLITELVQHYIFLYPTISFRLTHNKRIILDENTSSLESRLESSWGEDIFQQLIPFSYASTNVSAKGYLGKPQINASNAQKLLIYVNNRKVEDKLIASAVREAYGTLLMARAYPIGIIFLSTPQQFVDVNVHPTKKEVRFVHATEVFSEVKNGVLELLLSHNLTYQNVGPNTSSTKLKTTLKDRVNEQEIAHLGEVDSQEIIQIHQSYLIKQTKTGVMIIDQHAAHESLLYFEFLNAWKQEKKIVKRIQPPTPIILNLTVAEEMILQEHIETLTKIGFQLEEFGKHTYRIISIPAFYRDQNITAVVKELLNDFVEPQTSLSESDHYFLATLACKSAIKAGVPLNDEQRHKLCDALDMKHFAYTCPHGRPVKIEITLPQLARMFKRS